MAFFTCLRVTIPWPLAVQAENDDPDLLDGIVIPSPDTEIVELSLGEGEQETCDLPRLGGDC